MQHYFIHTGGPRAISFYESNFGILETALRLSALPTICLEEILHNLCRKAALMGTAVHQIHNCLDNSLQGVILPNLSTGVFGFTPYDASEISLASLLYPQQVQKTKGLIEKARQEFAKAREIHHKQEEIYIDNMDFVKMNHITQETIERIFGDMGQNKQGYGVHRFFGSATAQGNLNYIPVLTEDLERRFFIKGRPGTGKSTLLKQVAEAAKERGFRPEIYHCSLDPKSLDMVIIRELGCCIFDSTAPHEYFPTRKGDEILDIYTQCVTPHTDEQFAQPLAVLLQAYKEAVGTAMSALRAANESAQEYQTQLPPIQQEAVTNTEAAVVERLLG